MTVTGSNISMQGSSQSFSRTSTRTTLMLAAQNRQNRPNRLTPILRRENNPKPTVSQAPKANGVSISGPNGRDNMRLSILMRMLEAFGLKMKFRSPITTQENGQTYGQPVNLSLAERAGALAKTSQAGALMFTSETETVSQQAMSFSAQGVVHTADGKQIEIDVSLSMSQSFYEKVSVSMQAFWDDVSTAIPGGRTLKDPLVINFDNASAALSQNTFHFDIDSDGTSDQISQLAAGSGFLAVDLYGDGVIHDGNQLFGAASGDGFADLALHDGDKNGWIDESDAIFDKLRIWARDDSGNDVLYSLGQLGVGAIYLGNVSTEYWLGGGPNDMDGVIRNTGIFLREDGTAGTIQHIDLAI